VLGGGSPPAASVGGCARSLRVARNLCAGIGGEFRLANRPGGGVLAALVFPPALCAHLAAPSAEGAAVAADLSGLRILLAEDNASSRLVTAQMLRALGASVSLASDGFEALETFEGTEVDLVLADMEMPRVSGLDVIRALRARGDGRAGVPIVALSAATLPKERERILAAGADGLISKPVASPEALGAALRAHVPALRAPEPAEEVAPAPDGPVADLTVFDALNAAIGRDMMVELLGKVVGDLSEARRSLAGVLASLDRATIRGVSHILISVAGAVGATRLQACARGLNIAAHGEDARGLPAQVRRCILEIDAALDFVNGRRAPGRGGADAV
jgi:CheY-like chemotaxis protein